MFKMFILRFPHAIFIKQTKNLLFYFQMSLLALRPLIQGRPKIFSLLRSQIIRNYAQAQKESTAIAEARQQSQISADVKPIGERIKENTKTAGYMGVILLGITVTGGLFYAIFRELFSSTSPNSIYSAALEKCKNVKKFN